MKLVIVFFCIIILLSDSCIAQHNKPKPKALSLLKGTFLSVQKENFSNESLTKALVKIDSVIYYDSSYFDAYMVKMEFLCRMGKYPEALKALEKANTLNVNNKVLVETQLGFINDVMGKKQEADIKYRSALLACEKILKKTPDSLDIALNRVMLISYLKGTNMGKKEFAILAKTTKDQRINFFIDMSKEDPSEFEKMFDRNLIVKGNFVNKWKEPTFNF